MPFSVNLLFNTFEMNFKRINTSELQIAQPISVVSTLVIVIKENFDPKLFCFPDVVQEMQINH